MSAGKQISAVFPLSEKAEKQFDRYDEMLRDWNSRMDLTAVLSPEETVSRHYLDSLSGADLIPEYARVIDVGTGAGFPGLPLCIMRPDITITLLDAQRKRVDFLQAVIDELGLSATAVHGRAEDFARQERECYDCAVSRAVASSPILAEWLLPFVKPGGKCIFWKGPAVQDELYDANRVSALLGGGDLHIQPAVIPGLDWNHVFAVIEKGEPTPARFPRKAGMALKRPL